MWRTKIKKLLVVFSFLKKKREKNLGEFFPTLQQVYRRAKSIRIRIIKNNHALSSKTATPTGRVGGGFCSSSSLDDEDDDDGYDEDDDALEEYRCHGLYHHAKKRHQRRCARDSTTSTATTTTTKPS